MKKILFSACFMMSLYSLQAQENPAPTKNSKNGTGTVSFIPDDKLVIETKDQKIHVIVPDEDDMDAIFTTTNEELFTEIKKHVKRLSGKTDSVLQIRGTRLGAFSKIYVKQYGLFANDYQMRGLSLNKESSVFALSGYKIVCVKDLQNAKSTNDQADLFNNAVKHL
jgi:hypothetical protein